MNAAPVAAMAFGLESVIVSTLVSLVPTETGVKDFPTVSELATISVAFAAAVLEPPLVVVRPPAGMLLA